VRQNIMAMRHVAEATHLIMERKEREGEWEGVGGRERETRDKIPPKDPPNWPTSSS
jgi:hypothetical protein